MRILVIGQNYWPELTGIGPLTTDLCEYLVATGNDVTVLTSFPHYPAWEIEPGYRGKLFLDESRGGVKVRRSFIFVPRHPNAPRRALSDLSFTLTSALRGVGAANTDVVFTVSPPLTLGLTGYLLSRRYSAPLVTHIQDLIPQTAIAVNLIRNPALIRGLRSLERYVYQRSDAITVICQGFADDLRRRGWHSPQVQLLPNWVDTTFQVEQQQCDRFRAGLGLAADTALILHAGNIGYKQGLESLVGAASVLQGERRIAFAIIGHGARFQEVRAEAERNRLENIVFLPPQPLAVYQAALRAADVCIVCQRAGIVDAVMPTKLLSYMAAGRPVVASVHADSETARVLRRSNGGVVVPPEDPEALAQAILPLSRDRSLAAHLGSEGRRFVEEHFSRHVVLPRYGAFFERFDPASRRNLRAWERRTSLVSQ